MTERKNIITACGTIEQITTALKTIEKIFGAEAKLEEVATATRYGRITTAVRKQFEGGDNGEILDR